VTVCFGDADPEDAYDAQDRTADRLDVLHRIVGALEELPATDPRRVFRIGEALRLLDTIHRHRAEVHHLRVRLLAIR
jgi:hypothetical protein